MNNIMLREQMEILFQLIEEQEISEPTKTSVIDLSVDQQSEALVNEGAKAREALRALFFLKEGFSKDLENIKEKLDKLSAIETRLKSELIDTIKKTPGLDWKAVGFRVQKNSVAPINYKEPLTTTCRVVPNPQDFPQEYLEQKTVHVLKPEFTADLKSGFVKCDGAQILEPGEHLRLV